MKTLTTTILTVLVLTLSASASAQPLVVLETMEDHYGAGEFGTSLDIFAAQRFGDSGFGISAFALVGGGWSEAYAGPTYAPIDQLELGFSLGGQSLDGNLEMRYAASLWAGSGKVSGLTVVEFDHAGADGVWYDVTAKYQALDWLTAGVRARRFTGIGPTVWVTISDTPIGIWFSWTPWDPEGGTSLDRGVGAITWTF